MNCYKCGAQLAEGSQFCSNCGTNIVGSDHGSVHHTFDGGSNKLFMDLQDDGKENEQGNADNNNKQDSDS